MVVGAPVGDGLFDGFRLELLSDGAVGEGGRLHLDTALAHVAPEPALGGTFAYLADPDGAIVVVDLTTARIVRTSSVPFDPVGPPVLAAERIIVRGRDGRVWATTRPETAD